MTADYKSSNPFQSSQIVSTAGRSAVELPRDIKKEEKKVVYKNYCFINLTSSELVTLSDPDEDSNLAFALGKDKSPTIFNVALSL